MGFFSGIANSVNDAIDTVQQTVNNILPSNPVSDAVNSSVNASQSVFDNAANANPTQQLLIGGPLAAPGVVFDKSYAQAIQAFLSGDVKGGTAGLQAAGLSTSDITSNSTKNPQSSTAGLSGYGTAQEISAAAQGAVNAVSNASPVTKVLLIGGVAVAAFYIWKKFRR